MLEEGAGFGGRAPCLLNLTAKNENRPPTADHGRLRLHRRPAAAPVRLHLSAMAGRWRRVAGGNRADGEHRPRLLAEIPLGPHARPGARAVRAAPARPAAWLADGHPALAGAVCGIARRLQPGGAACRDGRGGAGRLPVRQPGHRGRCLAHRELPAAPAGRRAGGVYLGLPGGAADRDLRRHRDVRPDRLDGGAARGCRIDRVRRAGDVVGA